MGDFKKSYGGNKGGGGFNRDGGGGRPSYGGKPSYGGGDRGEREMFKATCAECGKPCEVPFRPSGDRPVYCKDCFAAMGPQDRNDRPFPVKRDAAAPRRDFAPSPRPYSPAPSQQGSGEDKRLDDIKIQLATVVSKLDKLINLQSNTAHTAPKSAKPNTESLHDTIAKAVPAVASKKESKGKKKVVSKKK